MLADVALEVTAGELVVLTGEDGCGTSSLLRLLPGALLPQPPGEDWAPHDVVSSLAGQAALDELGAGRLIDRELWTLSGGERQRVRLARALADPAPVLLLDEPLGYLDGAGVRTALAVVRARADAGRAVLVVAKGDPRAAEVADRVLVLADGRLSPI